ncbi:MerR family transcriptional regulator [Telmatospirillum sp. J64-1]|uniref:MerR family transcriptional regulator n=1 Tax=Telmatospirillum sp. J64-1 TaxID=2502183 RepID=UPI00115CBDED
MLTPQQTQASAPEEGRRSGKSEAAFRTISEVAEELDVPQHVLRFWESKFSQIRPLKRGGGRRYYRPEDIQLLRRIRELLYEDRYTIKGVQKLLRENGGKAPPSTKPRLAPLVAEPTPPAATVAPQMPPQPAAPQPAPMEPQAEAAPAPVSPVIEPEPPAPPRLSEKKRQALNGILEELLELKKILKKVQTESCQG